MASLRVQLRRAAFDTLPRSIYIRQLSTSSGKNLKSTLSDLIPDKRERLMKLRKEHGNVSLGEVTIESAIGGMRGLKAMLWEVCILNRL